MFEVTENPDVFSQEFEIVRDQGRLMLSIPKYETPFDFHDYCNRRNYETIGAHVDSHPTSEISENP